MAREAVELAQGSTDLGSDGATNGAIETSRGEGAVAIKVVQIDFRGRIKQGHTGIVETGEIQGHRQGGKDHLHAAAARREEGMGKVVLSSRLERVMVGEAQILVTGSVNVRAAGMRVLYHLHQLASTGGLRYRIVMNSRIELIACVSRYWRCYDSVKSGSHCAQEACVA